MNPEQRYEALAKAFLGNSNVSQEGKGFGSEALKTRGRIFAMLSQGTLVVKLPKARVDALVDAGEGHRFDPRHDGRGRWDSREARRPCEGWSSPHQHDPKSRKHT